MSRWRASLGSGAFFIIAPGMVAGAVPWWITHYYFSPPFFGLSGVRVAGAVLVAAGLLELVESFARFALRGMGTPAPVLPTQSLVVTGLYRHVRNPMYLAVLSVVLGQAALFGNIALLVYAALLFGLFDAFVRLYEEPVLRRRFGEDYVVYCRRVARWIPQFSREKRKR